LRRRPASLIVFTVNWMESIRRWRQMPETTRREARWSRVPRQVALSMAFEREPVDAAWLTTRHRLTTPPVPSKRRADS
jgi:hypothetical protein